MEVLFALVGEVLFLSIAFPSLMSWMGIMLVVIGMVLHSYITHAGLTAIPAIQPKSEQNGL